jgi:hypothetical protein
MTRSFRIIVVVRALLSSLLSFVAAVAVMHFHDFFPWQCQAHSDLESYSYVTEFESRIARIFPEAPKSNYIVVRAFSLLSVFIFSALVSLLHSPTRCDGIQYPDGKASDAENRFECKDSHYERKLKSHARKV